ncbi:ArpU family transcriptional regulator [Paenibacillus lactis]|uniref:ArpU family phage packaging/lysis transcriptional regulator n=1 Tax=Paenibacillus lactis TaxID=228574 RepID=UPI00203EB392|nr:ArpU family phage packaging/lysis transcriptional regulator [Paenibacillus lactis]MCM3492861.1 ArpU family transcriptional regulator [Paenibacillus lactis]
MRAEARDVFQLALMEINREETRRRVEQELERARIYKMVGFVRRETQQTPSYEPRYHGATNTTSNQIENVAIFNVDTEARLKQAYDRVNAALRGLSRMEKDIINMRYLDEEDVQDFNVYNELALSERSYYRRKSRALYKMAFAMRLEVFIGEETA